MTDLDKTRIFVPAMRGRSVPDARLIRVVPRANSPEIIPLTGDGLSLVCDSAGNLSESDGNTPDFKFFQISGAWGVQVLTSNVSFTVNKKQMTVSFLESGDDIDFGGTHYIFRWADEPENAEISSTPPAPKQNPVAQEAYPERRTRHFELQIAILILEMIIIFAGVLVLGLELT